MLGRENDRLDAATWFAQLNRLVEALPKDDACPDRHIRRAYYLQRLAPQALEPMMAIATEDEFEAMLEQGDYENAVAQFTSPVGLRKPFEDCASTPHHKVHGDLASSTGSSSEAQRIRAVLEAWASSFLRSQPLAQ